MRVRHQHTVKNVALETKHTEAELALNQFTDQFHAAIAQRVDVVGRFLGVVETNNLFDNGDEIFHLKRAVRGVVWSIEAEALVHLIAANARRIIATIVKERVFDHRLGVFDGRKIAWAQTPVNLEKSGSLVVSRVFLKGGIDIADSAVVDILESFADFCVVGNPERTQESRDGDFAAAVDFDVDTAAGCGLELEPSTATWNYLRAVITFAVHFISSEENARRTDELRNDDTFGAVDNEGGAVGHPGIVTEVNILFLNLAGNLVGQLDLDVKRSRIGRKVVLRSLFVFDRILEIIIFEPERQLIPIVVVDWVQLIKNLPQTGLHKIIPAVLLVCNEIRNRKRLVTLGEKYAGTIL